MDPDLQRRPRRRRRNRVRARPRRRRGPDRRPAAGRAGARRGRRGAQPTSPAPRSRAPATSRRSTTSPTIGPLGHTVLLGDFVTTEDGTGLVHTAHRLRRGRLPARRAVRDDAAEPCPARRSLRRPRPGFRRASTSRRHDPEIVAALEAKRTTVSLRGLRARLPALLALRDAAALLREGELVHPHDRGPRPDAGRERADRLAPRARQARALRQVAGGQRGLGALARALLGHAAADLGVHDRSTATATSAPARSPSCASAPARSPTTCTAPTSTRS